MEFKKDKGIYIMPIIFLTLSLVALIIIPIILRGGDVKTIISLITIPCVIFVISFVFFIIRLKASNVRFTIDDKNLYVGDLEVDFKAIDFLRTKVGLFTSTYRPNIEIVLKSKEIISISYVKNPMDACKIINKKYLKLKGPGIR